jgi:hypothetical protein
MSVFVVAIVAPPDGRSLEEVGASMHQVEAKDEYEAHEHALSDWLTQGKEVGEHWAEWEWRFPAPTRLRDDPFTTAVPIIDGEESWGEAIVFTAHRVE